MLLDVDGTLVDSNEAHVHAWLEAFAGVGLDVPPSLVRPLIGMGGDRLIETLTGWPRDSEKAGLIAPGDVGYFDEDGFLYLCDRAKDMIISGGVNIYPAEIEAELLKMPGVADCAVFGIPDEEFGEAVCAIVQPQPGADLDEASVKAWLRGHVSGYKLPRRVELATDLPREDSGKIFKRKLREPFWAGLERRI